MSSRTRNGAPLGSCPIARSETTFACRTLARSRASSRIARSASRESCPASRLMHTSRAKAEASDLDRPGAVDAPRRAAADAGQELEALAAGGELTRNRVIGRAGVP